MQERTIGKAWVHWGQETLWSEGAIERDGLRTPIASLIESIYQTRPAIARKICRSRIYSDYEPTLFCHGVMRVHAKRFSRAQAPNTLALVSRLEPSPEVAVDREPPELALAEEKPLYDRHRNVTAALKDPLTGDTWHARNTNARNRLAHAELHLVRFALERLESGLVPRGVLHLHASLKPCRMCAAAIVQIRSRLPLVVTFEVFDPGPNGRATALDIGSYDHGLALRLGYGMDAP